MLLAPVTVLYIISVASVHKGTPTPALEEKKMSIIVNEKNKTFHLYNNQISYLMSVLPNGHIGQLYFGEKDPPQRGLFLFAGENVPPDGILYF